MTRHLVHNRFALIICLAISIFYFWKIDQVPFHPDESTQIYMSQDLVDIVKDLSSLSYTPESKITNKMIYRGIDMPLTRYLIGLSSLMTDSPGLNIDWNWSQSWEENNASGAFPTSRTLLVARFLPSLLLSVSLYLFYLIAIQFLPKVPAYIALLFLALNPLILLHGRRAMAEPVLLFGLIFFLWAITQDRVKPVVVGVALAIAINAKQTGVFLLPAGIIAVCMAADDKLHLKDMLARSLIVITIILFSTYLLNPYYWKFPLEAFSASIQMRSELFDLQLSDHLQGEVQNFITLLYYQISNLFISYPSYYETTKYASALKPQIILYESFFPHIWGRNLVFGSINLTLIVSGFYQLIRRYNSQAQKYKQKSLLLALVTVSMSTGVLFALPIPWQRYIVPLLPILAIWFGFSLLPLQDALDNAKGSSKSKNEGTI